MNTLILPVQWIEVVSPIQAISVPFKPPPIEYVITMFDSEMKITFNSTKLPGRLIVIELPLKNDHISFS